MNYSLLSEPASLMKILPMHLVLINAMSERLLPLV